MHFPAALVLLITISISSAVALNEDDAQAMFVRFVADYGKSYPADAVFQRYAAFKHSLAVIEKHNALNTTWKMGVNQFADLLPEEFKAQYLSNYVPEPSIDSDSHTRIEAHTQPLSQRSVLAQDIDWRDRGFVTPVKTQGACGSGWAFAATGALEAYLKQKNNTLLSLSEQQLVDCAGSAGNAGCFGGVPANAISWVSKNDGLCKGADYPYKAIMGVCQTTCKPVVKNQGMQKNRGEPALVKNIQSFPVATGIDASGIQLYKSGTLMNQGVLVVGGVSSGPTQPYWIVKNSYGPQWGVNGYIWMEQGLNLCGMANDLAWPT